MKSKKSFVAAALAALLLAVPASAEGEGAHARLLEAKKAPVVALKYVMQVTASMGGQQVMDQEINGNTTGIVVDKSGLIMVPAGAFDARSGIPRRARRQQNIEITSVPNQIRVIFPGSDKEYPAILGAKDTKLGLAFVLIKDLEGLDPAVLDLSATAEPSIGQTLYGVTRLDQGFDHAAMVDTVKVVGKVTKPRAMWALNTAGSFLAEPLYNEAGAVVGICVSQDGVGEDSGRRPFVLSLKVAQPTMKRAMREAQGALEEILDAEEEAAEAAAEEAAENAAEEGAEKPAEGDGEKPAEGDGE